MFIACNSFLSNSVCEKQAVTWIQWLVEQTAHFEQVKNILNSFKDHFRLDAICSLNISELFLQFKTYALIN